jgi:hypothetical protein
MAIGISKFRVSEDRVKLEAAIIEHVLDNQVRVVICTKDTANTLTVLHRFCEANDCAESVVDPQDYEDLKSVLYDYDREVEIALDAINDVLPVGLYCVHSRGEIVITNEVRA